MNLDNNDFFRQMEVERAMEAVKDYSRGKAPSQVSLDLKLCFFHPDLLRKLKTPALRCMLDRVQGYGEFVPMRVRGDMLTVIVAELERRKRKRITRGLRMFKIMVRRVASKFLGDHVDPHLGEYGWYRRWRGGLWGLVTFDIPGVVGNGAWRRQNLALDRCWNDVWPERVMRLEDHRRHEPAFLLSHTPERER